MLRARSLLSRVFVSCSCVFISWFGFVRLWIDRVPSVSFMGHPAFPFIGQGKAWVTTEEKEKNQREEGFQDRWVLLLLHTGPIDPVDVNKDGSTS